MFAFAFDIIACKRRVWAQTMPNKGADLDHDGYLAIAKALPAKAWEYGKLVKVKSLNFRRAPQWDKVQLLAPALHTLLERSKGKQVRQKSFAASLKKWAHDDKLHYTADALDTAAFTLRCIVAQLIHHKTKEREVPKDFRRTCQTLFDKVSFDFVASDEVEDSQVEEVCAELDDASAQTVASSESDGTFKARVLGADDPDLQQLLVGGAAEKDLPDGTPKKKPAMSMDGLRKLAAGSSETFACPGAFNALNREIKAKEKAEGSREIKKKPASSNVESDAKNMLKRKHSQAWHAEYSFCTKKLLLPEEQAKARASEAGRKASEDWRKEQAKGKEA